ncbi:MAG: hypothetical protein E6K05_02910 [Methanobacteriota archaeon]|nr:MAG: hypothetical protein E6K05_02910 [Euryarchaeota archaeon]
MTERLRSKALRARLMDADEAVRRFVPERGSIAFSCMGGSSLAKEIPEALARSADAGRRYELTLLTGGATTTGFETCAARLSIRRRFPYLSEAARTPVNEGSVEFFDCRIGEYPNLVRQGTLTAGKPLDVAVVEATAIDEKGRLIPALSLDALPAFVEASRRVIVELNERKPDLTGLHDIYRVRPGVPIPIRGVRDRVGTPFVRVAKSKIAAIVRTDREDMPSAAYSGPGPTDLRVAEGVAGCLAEELTGHAWGGRFALQLGAGPLAAALMEVLPFRAAANTSHVGRNAHNGVGGSQDFTRAARLVVVAMASTAAGDRYSRIVPLLSSPDIPRQDVDVLVTEQGHADLRGFSPRERAERVIDRCSHPRFREDLWAYYRAAKEAGGHLPFSLEAASRFAETQGRP